MKLSLNDGNQIPEIGLGTWRLTDRLVIEKVIPKAIEIGYRHIDTALCYENEDILGDVLSNLFNEGFDRKNIFITSKLWNSYHKRASEGLNKTLQDLKVDYLDLYLIHWPVTFKYDSDGNTVRDNNAAVLEEFDLKSVWTQMEAFVREGKVRSIGVANFGIENLGKLLSFCTIKPAVNQIEFHPYLQQIETVDFCKVNGITVVSYSSLGSQFEEGQNLILREDRTLKRIAKKYEITVPQLILNWILQKGIAVIPKSSSEEHLRENFVVKNLNIVDVEEINNIDIEFRYCNPKSFGPGRFK